MKAKAKIKRNGKVKLADFKPQAKNLNQHTAYGLKVIDDSIRRDGWIGAMTVAADGETFDGSARLEKGADIFGLDVEPIVVDVDGSRPVIVRRTDIKRATDPRAKRLAFVANQSQVVDWNPDADLLAQLAGEDELVKRLAQEDKRLRELLKATNGQGEAPAAQIDKADALKKKWGTKLGQVWQLGEHRLIVGDSTKSETVKRLVRDNKISLICTDPPWNVGWEYIGGYDDSKTVEEYADWTNKWVKVWESCTLAGAFVFVWQSMKNCRHFSTWFKRDYRLFCECQNFVQASGSPIQNAVNPVVVWSIAGKPFIKGQAGRRDYFVSQTSVVRDEGDLSRLNTAARPLDSVEYIVENWAGEIVGDPFCGSGTTLMACENQKRVFMGCELSPAYVAVTLERWATLTGLTPQRVAHT